MINDQDLIQDCETGMKKESINMAEMHNDHDKEIYTLFEEVLILLNSLKTFKKS